MIIKREIGEKGQVVIPKDVRLLLGVKPRQNIIFEVENNEVRIKPEKDPEEFLKDFLNVPKVKRPLTTKEIKKELEERYEIHRS